MGTTWEKIEGKFPFGTSGNGDSKQIGGSNTVVIARENLPNIKLTIDSHTHTQKTHKHQSPVGNHTNSGSQNSFAQQFGASAFGKWGEYTNLGGGETTGTASPQTEVMGNGKALDITPPYYTVHIWLRLT